MSLPIHRWFRYSAGFSANWVRQVVQQQMALGARTLFDPFAGSGTALLEGEYCGLESIGVEAHPFVARIARAKLLWRHDAGEFRSYANMILQRAMQEAPDLSRYPSLITKCYPPEILARLGCLHKAWEQKADNSPSSELTWLCLVSILREVSPVGTAQWQYVLPRRSKAKAVDPYSAFESRVTQMSQDMMTRQRLPQGPSAVLIGGDARTCVSIPSDWVDLVITSPPYANNYDYADATRLEMTFLGEVQEWRDLQNAVRKYLMRSCTQHVANMTNETQSILFEPELAPIRDELQEVYGRLECERQEHGGKKPYHTMIVAYFYDLAKTWSSLRRVTTKGRSVVCFVVGDSAPYGVYIPVDQWLGQLALEAGFNSFTFEKIRDRNIKWKNRKHRVPLHEGRLWVQG